jgi:putative SOS response-associated peptidase YedK
MCSRFAIGFPHPVIQERFKVNKFEWKPRFNIAPTSITPVITKPGTVEMMTWGLIPSWSKDEKIHINARSETYEHKASFKDAKRCLVIASGFYEWKEKIPHMFQTNNDLFVFAGLYSEYKGIKRYTILTTTPNEMVKKVHDRMPVILDPLEEDLWLEGRNVPLDSYPEKKMLTRIVDSKLNNSRNEGEDLIKPVLGLKGYF